MLKLIRTERIERRRRQLCAALAVALLAFAWYQGRQHLKAPQRLGLVPTLHGPAPVYLMDMDHSRSFLIATKPAVLIGGGHFLDVTQFHKQLKQLKLHPSDVGLVILFSEERDQVGIARELRQLGAHVLMGVPRAQSKHPRARAPSWQDKLGRLVEGKSDLLTPDLLIQTDYDLAPWGSILAAVQVQDASREILIVTEDLQAFTGDLVSRALRSPCDRNSQATAHEALSGLLSRGIKKLYDASGAVHDAEDVRRNLHELTRKCASS